MWYEIIADLVAVLHLAFIAFVLFGAALGLRNGWWRAAHIVAMVYGVLIEVFYWYCPLTAIEQWLRRRAGGASYSEPFIAHYLNRIIYIDVPQGLLIAAAATALAINAGLYLRAWLYRFRPPP
jgi:uncharacterized protein DUF2784